MKTFYWLVKREMWEHRGGFFWTPVIVGGVFLVLNLMAIIAGEFSGHGFTMNGNDVTRMISDMDAGQLEAVGMGLDVAMYSSAVIMCIVLGFVVIFYCLGALYDDRRDKSILFWKSLPLSDTSTVLSKVATATIVAPIITVLAGVVTGILMLLLYALVLSFHGVGVWHLLTLAHPFRVIANLIGSVPLYLLWALPTIGWLLLCSAWAKSKPVLWALLIPVAVGLVLGWFNILGSTGLSSSWYWTNIFGRAVLSAFPGGWLPTAARGMSFENGSHFPHQALGALDLSTSYRVLATPNLWIGVAAGAILIGASIWLRRWRDEA